MTRQPIQETPKLRPKSLTIQSESASKEWETIQHIKHHTTWVTNNGNFRSLSLPDTKESNPAAPACLPTYRHPSTESQTGRTIRGIKKTVHHHEAFVTHRH